MTKITGTKVSAEENQGTVSIQTGGVERIGVGQNGTVNLGTTKWASAALSASGTGGSFTAGPAATPALSASRWDGGSGTTYAVADIVAALKAVNILGA